MAKFIRFEAGWKLYIFYHKVLGDVVKTMALLRALRNIRDVLASAQVFQFMYVEKNLFYYKEILHYATLRSE